MHQQIAQIQQSGYRPVIFIDEELKKHIGNKKELLSIERSAVRLGVPVFTTDTAVRLNRLHKVHVFRYGHLPQISASAIVRKGGRIVPGSLRPLAQLDA